MGPIWVNQSLNSKAKESLVSPDLMKGGEMSFISRGFKSNYLGKH